MPDEIIVESWRVAIVRSADLMRRKLARMSVALLGTSSSMSTTIRPLDRSCDATACLSLPSISPRVGTPARSSALKPKLAIGPYATRTVPMRRRSSSGVDERCSASSRVILPWRTRSAIAASIVCMPCVLPVWSTE